MNAPSDQELYAATRRAYPEAASVCVTEMRIQNGPDYIAAWVAPPAENPFELAQWSHIAQATTRAGLIELLDEQVAFERRITQ
jgi:hypothetical protein